GGLFGGQVDLGALDGEHELLFVGRVEDVESGLLAETLGDHFGESGVEVVAAEFADALAADLLENAVVDAQDRHIESAAAEVIDKNRLVLLGVEAVADGGRGRLVDERENLHAAGAGAEFGGVTGQSLRIGGDRHDRLDEGLAQALL